MRNVLLRIRAIIDSGGIPRGAVSCPSGPDFASNCRYVTSTSEVSFRVAGALLLPTRCEEWRGVIELRDSMFAVEDFRFCNTGEYQR